MEQTMTEIDGKRMLLLPLMNLIGPNLANMTREQQRNFFNLLRAIGRHILGEDNE